MGKMTMNGSAGGTPSDECTAIKGYVLAPYTAVTSDSGDEAVSGTMPNNGAWTGQIGVNGRVAVPTGYHSGSGYVGQSIPTQGGKTVTPGASQQTAVAAGRYVTGDIVVPGFALPAANTIKKGVTINIYGRTVTGTFEGYVPTPTDLYLRGNNVAGFVNNSNAAIFDAGQISFQTGRDFEFELKTSKAYNVSGYTRLTLECSLYNQRVANNVFMSLKISRSSGNWDYLTPEFNLGAVSHVGNQTFSFKAAITGTLTVFMRSNSSYHNFGPNSVITRIWLS